MYQWSQAHNILVNNGDVLNQNFGERLIPSVNIRACSGTLGFWTLEMH